MNIIKNQSYLKYITLTFTCVFLTGFVVIRTVNSENYKKPEETKEVVIESELAKFAKDNNFFTLINMPEKETENPTEIEIQETQKETEPVPETTETVQKYTDAELDLLSRLVHAEASYLYLRNKFGISPYEANLWQQGVACVVLNRVESSKFPNTMYDVIYQKGQYYCTKNGSINNPADEHAIENAKKVLEGDRPFPNYVLFQAEFMVGSNLYWHIGNTYFSY